MNTAVFLRKIGKPFIALFLSVAFFSTYNLYFIDHSLEDLNLSLSHISRISDTKNTALLTGILDSLLISEVSAETLSPVNVNSLSFIQGLSTQSLQPAQLQDLSFMLKEIISKREAKRSRLLKFTDEIMRLFRSWASEAQIFINKNFLKRIPTSLIQKESLFNSATLMESRGRFMEAISFYKGFIEVNPDYPEINFVKIKMVGNMLKAGQYNEARRTCQEIIDSAKNETEINVAKRLTAKINGIGTIKRHISMVANQIPGISNPSRKQKAYFTIGVLHEKAMDFQSSQEAFQKAIQAKPESSMAERIIFNLGWAYKFGCRLQESSAEFKKIVDKKPESELAQIGEFQIADNLKKEGRFDEAIDLYNKIYSRAQNSETGKIAKFQAGYIQLYDLNDYVAAKKSFDLVGAEYEGTSLGKYSAKLTIDLGKQYRLEGFKLLSEEDTWGAREQFQKAIALNPQDGKAYGETARSYILENKLDKAVEWAENGIKADKEDEYSYAILAKIHEQQGNLTKALEYYKECLLLDPDYPQVYYNMGVDYNLLGEYDKAIEMLGGAIKYSPKFAEAHNNLGAAFWNKGEYSKAADEYRKAVEIKPDYADALYNLAMVYKAQKQFPEARKLLRKALDAQPGLSEAQKELNSIP